MVLLFALSFVVAGVKVKFPMDYNQQVEFYSDKYNLDADLIYAVINVESGYNTMAKSRVGAIGLMQIMPETAIWIANELNISNFNYEMMFTPELNIEFGCFYLNYLFSKYENEHKVLFAYNAGEGVMNETYSFDEPLIVETVEIKETREYIDKVIKCKQVYKRLMSLKSV